MIMMTSNKYQVIQIKSKTQAEMFKHISPGDILQFSIPLQYAGSGRGTHASYITIKNLSRDNNNIAYKSFNQLPGLISKFELKEIEPNEQT